MKLLSISTLETAVIVRPCRSAANTIIPDRDLNCPLSPSDWPGSHYCWSLEQQGYFLPKLRYQSIERATLRMPGRMLI